MHTFEITIQRQAGDHYPLIAEEHRSDGGLPIRSEAMLTIDARELLALESDPAAYGRSLGQALFRDTLREGFVEALARTTDRLRVLLFIEDVNLRGLRWERLFAPIDNDWRLLATYQRAPFSRYLPSLTDRRFPPIGRRDLRALIVAASPPPDNRFQLQPFDLRAATDGVRAALGPIPATLLADLPGADGRPTLDEICARLTAEAYPLLHIVCHGRVLKDGESLLFLAGNEGPQAIDPVTGTRLIERLIGLEGVRGLPHFAFLSTCESASPDADEALGGLGQRLVRELGMPAVVAMTDRISIVTANALSGELYRRLREHGEPDRALVEGSVQLVEQGDVTVPVLFSRLGGRALFSDTLDRALTAAELSAGLTLLEQALPVRAPILLNEYLQAATVVRGTLQRSLADLDVPTQQARTQALATIDAICSEALDLSFQQVCLGDDVPPYDGRCPFPGLRSFQSELREFFFGREAAVARLAARCDESLFLAVLGPSGSGKSSLVFAGLVPELQRREPHLPLISLTPGELPLAALDFALEQSGLALSGEVRRQAILLIDQFEEVFTLCRDEDERRTFVDELLKLPGRFLVLITMRADFLGEVASYPALRDRVQNHQELIAPMTPEELRRAMELQAAAVGLRFEADLGGQILDDVRGEPGAMPLLQHALQELWQRRRGRWLRSAEYRAIGGIQQAIAYSADQIFDNSSPEDKERLRTIFIRLTRVDRDQQAEAGDERRDTRQRVYLSELVSAGADPALTRALVSRLANARLVVTSGRDIGDEMVEVAHEALIRSWPRLRAWLNEDRQGLLLLEAIRSAARDWQAGGRDEGFLFRGARLEEALTLLRNPRFGLNNDEQQFIAAGIQLREQEETAREAARQRELEQARALALEQEERLRAEQLRAEESAQAARQLRQRAVFLAGVAVVALIATIAAGIGFVQAAVQGGVAESNAARAEAQAATAEVARELAEVQQQTAVAANNEAQQQRQRADASTQDAAQRAIVGDAQAALNSADLDQALALSLAAVENGNPLGRALFVLSQAADRGTRQLFDGFEAPINSVAYSSDGRFVAAGDSFGVVQIWAADSGNLVRRYEYRNETADTAINRVRFMPNNDLLIAGAAGQVIRLGAADGQLFDGGDGTAIVEMLLNSDATRLITVADSGALVAWDPLDQRAVARLAQIDDASIQAMALGNDDRILVALFDETQIPPLDVLREFPPDGVGPVRDIALSYATDLSDPGRLSPCRTQAVQAVRPTPLVLIGCDNGLIQLRNIDNGQLVRTFVGHDSPILDLALVDDGAYFVSSSLDQSVLLWDTEAGDVVWNYEGHRAEIDAIAVAPDNATILTGSFDRTARLWDIRGGQRIRAYSAELEPQLRNVFTSFNAAGDQISAIDTSRALRWSIDDSQPRSVIELPGEAITLSPDGSLTLLFTSEDVQVWDVEQNTAVSVLSEFPDGSAFAAFSADNQYVATVTELSQIQLWSVRDGSLIREFVNDDSLLSPPLVFSPDGTQIAMGEESSVSPLVRVWDVASGEIVLRLSGHSDNISALAFSPDGTQLVSGSWDRTVRIWDVNSGEELQQMFGHERVIQAVALSADNQLALSGGDDRTARLWSTASGNELLRYSGFNTSVLGASFGPDGSTALTSSASGEIVLWRAPGVSELIDWIDENRYVPELDCDTLTTYALPCD